MADADARIGGRYRLDRQLASGGMGTVWQAWDERLLRPVAVKKLHLQPGLGKAEREVAIERAMREGRITARLHHPNAVQVYDVVDEGDGPCLIMQYVPSRSLQDIVRDEGPRQPAEAARIGIQVAAALAAAHRAGIVHRDVKPGNVLIAEDGTAKITDFGISHAFDDVALTSTGMVTGTPAYLAPEVARGADSGFTSDVWSLGATLYMAVEGRPPFGNDQNPMAMLHKVASGEPDPPTHSGPLTPMLAAMMSRDPAARPSMVEVANALPYVAATPEPAPATVSGSTTQVIARPRPAPPPPPPVLPPPTPMPAPDESVPDRGRGRLWLPLAIAALLFALAAILAIVLLNGSGNGNTPGTGGSTSSHSRSAALSTSPSGRRTTSHAASSATHSASANRSSVSSAAKSTAGSSTAGSSTAGSSTASSSAASSSGSTNSGGGGAPTNQDLSNAVTQYFQLVPGNLDAGWARLTPHFQRTRAGGRANYDNYWNGISRVDVAGVTGQAPHQASATLTYHYKDGNVVTQYTSFYLLTQGGVLKIDGES